MQKQIVKGVTMIMLIAAVAFMAALVSAHAQSSNQILVDIPFEFTVGGQSLHAGEYSVRKYTTSGDAVLVRSQDADGSAMRLTRAISTRIVPQKATLVFHRYGQRYFLSEIWTPGERTGRQLLKSREERNLEDQLAAISSKGEVAQSTYETVEIVAMVR